VPNTVTASGTPAGGILDDAVDALVIPVNPAPAFELVKAATTIPGGANETIDYTFTVVNTGNVTISNVAIVDAKCATPIVLDSEQYRSHRPRQMLARS